MNENEIESRQEKVLTRKEAKLLRKQEKIERLQSAPPLVRIWHTWLKYVVLMLLILALLAAVFLYAAYRYVMHEAQLYQESLVLPEAGDLLSFTTKDLDGNEISSEELFRDHKFTMLNIWATWCGPCKGELPELGKMAAEFEARGCQIVGLCTDGNEEAATAKKLLAEAGAGYLNIIAPENMDQVLPVGAIPTSYFVDSEGRIVGEPIVGAYVDEYITRLEALT